MGYSLCGHKGSDTTEGLTLSLFTFHHRWKTVTICSKWNITKNINAMKHSTFLKSIFN